MPNIKFESGLWSSAHRPVFFMINEIQAKKLCNEDISLIENYDKAIADTAIWDLHHRREIFENKSAQQLKDENLYEHRPAKELIFLTHAEHARLHGKNMRNETKEKLRSARLGKKLSDETKQKISEAKLGTLPWNKGKIGIYSAETKQKMSEIHTNISDETRQKMREAKIGKQLSIEHKQKIHEVLSGKPKSTEHKLKLCKIRIGMHWWNNGVVNKLSKECPGSEWKKGRL